jgi:hypothetical protein
LQIETEVPNILLARTMSVERRAILIAFLGPAIQAIGFAWETLHLLIAHWSTPLTARHIMYDPAVLLIAVGFFVSLVCLPVALEVAQAKASEVKIPLYEPEQMDEPQQPTTRLQRWRASR